MAFVPEPLWPISAAMFAEQRRRLTKTFAEKALKGVIFLQGGEQQYQDNTDMGKVFRQESFFYYLTGSADPGDYGDRYLCTLQVPEGKMTLFVPRLPPSFAVWMGRIKPLEEYKTTLEVDDVCYSDTVADWMAKTAPPTIFVLKGVNTDSDVATKLTAEFPEMNKKYNVDATTLHPILVEQRVRKTATELDLMRYANRVSSRAHVEVMKSCKSGMSQRHLESLFLHNVYFHGGCRHTSYTCICATGSDAAVLHYIENNKVILDGQMTLLDMGGEYACYASDITCAYPVNGKFTEKQRLIYQGVLNAQRAVFRAIKPGACWIELHKLAMRTATDQLREIGIVRGTWEELCAAQIPYLFQPHGLGHMLGMDVHDVGGIPEGKERPQEEMLKKLRNIRLLEVGFVVTVEPGIYFNHVLLESAFKDPNKSKYLNEALIRAEYWNFGGVRIEDNIIVTANGCENMTCCPRDIDDVEATMAGQPRFFTNTYYVNE